MKKDLQLVIIFKILIFLSAIGLSIFILSNPSLLGQIDNIFTYPLRAIGIFFSLISIYVFFKVRKPEKVSLLNKNTISVAIISTPFLVLLWSIVFIYPILLSFMAFSLIDSLIFVKHYLIESINPNNESIDQDYSNEQNDSDYYHEKGDSDEDDEDDEDNEDNGVEASYYYEKNTASTYETDSPNENNSSNKDLKDETNKNINGLIKDKPDTKKEQLLLTDNTLVPSNKTEKKEGKKDIAKSQNGHNNFDSYESQTGNHYDNDESEEDFGEDDEDPNNDNILTINDHFDIDWTSLTNYSSKDILKFIISIMLADGITDFKEIYYLKKICKLGFISDEEFQNAIEEMQNIEDPLKYIIETTKLKYDKNLILVLIEIAAVDGNIAAEEENLIYEIAKHMYFPKSEVKEAIDSIKNKKLETKTTRLIYN